MTRHRLLLKEKHDRLSFEIGDGVTLGDYAEECEPGGILVELAKEETWDTTFRCRGI